ncbi:MAG: DUF2281 domain-containing protein [Cyanobacteria bacterium SBLK]|nr:DUF2281 domain-containing protein [Cyanobacteria bacterium SBLK]
MTQAIEQHKTAQYLIQEKIKSLTSEQQQEVLNFLDFLQFKSQKPEQKKSVSFLEAAGEFMGCVSGGSGDLATNKKYLRELV